MSDAHDSGLARTPADIDPRSHPDWTGGPATVLDHGDRVAKFKNRFGSTGG